MRHILRSRCEITLCASSPARTSDATRVSLVVTLLILALVAGLVLPPESALARLASRQDRSPVAPRRNVLLLISDDQGRDVMGAYGNRIVKTPHQDRLAAEGVRFTNAFATVASCSPSRASIFTGMYQHQNGQYGLAHATHNQHTFESVRAAPRIFGEHGYRTAIIGKHHVVPLDLYGFQQIIPAAHGSRDVAEMARSARGIFAERDARPFFLTIGYSDPHRGGGAISDSMTDGRGNFANERQYAGVTAIKYQPAEVTVPAHLPDTPEVRAELAQYYEAVSRLDQGIGMVMQALRDTNQLENTLVIYVSDNGIPFPGAKTNLYDAGIRLPMLMRLPGREKRGTINNAMVSFIDIAPTVAHDARGHDVLPYARRPNARP